MILIENALIVNENRKFKGNILIENDRISRISREPIEAEGAERIDASGLICIPGLIDDQVHAHLHTCTCACTWTYAYAHMPVHMHTCTRRCMRRWTSLMTKHS